MMTYIFKTTISMKENSRFYIPYDTVAEWKSDAESLNDAIKDFADDINQAYRIDISKTAMSRKAPMYRDLPDGSSRQVGYIFTGSMYLLDDNNVSKKVYFDLWVEMMTVVETNFGKAA